MRKDYVRYRRQLSQKMMLHSTVQHLIHILQITKHALGHLAYTEYGIEEGVLVATTTEDLITLISNASAPNTEGSPGMTSWINETGQEVIQLGMTLLNCSSYLSGIHTGLTSKFEEEEDASNNSL